jgi:uroporphyrinogen decarboxylase
MDRLRYVFDAVAEIRRALNGRVPLIGFAGSPWTLACYMVEGAGSSEYRLIKTMLYSRPDLLHRILAINADAVAAYLNAQIDAGAQAVMVFDSWGGVLSHAAFQDFSLAYIERVLGQLIRMREGRRVPAIVFTKGGGLWLEAIAASGPDVIGLDWTVDIAAARRRLGSRVALQGNLDPSILYGTPEAVRDEAVACLDRLAATGSLDGHVFNLGHGISQHTPPENVAVLVDAVHVRSRALRGRRRDFRHGLCGPFFRSVGAQGLTYPQNRSRNAPTKSMLRRSITVSGHDAKSLISLGPRTCPESRHGTARPRPSTTSAAAKGGFAQSFPQAQWKGAKAFPNQRLTRPF